MHSFNSEFNIGDSVYHATADSDRGIVIDVFYSLRTDLVRYNVVFGRRGEDDGWFWGDELSVEKIF